MADFTILLGAGASTPYGVPTFAEFRSAAKRIVGREELISLLLILWERVYDDINLEEFYSLLQNQLDVGASVQLLGSGVLRPQEEKALAGTDYLTGDLLNFDYAMSQVESLIPHILLASAKPRRSAAYHNLVDRILDAEGTVRWSKRRMYYGTDVISFNWDTLFEMAAGGAQVPVRYPADSRPPSPYISVCNPHGSIKLEACLNHRCPMFGITHRDQIGKLYGEGTWFPLRCRACHRYRELVLLAPTFIKEPNPALSDWHHYTLRSAYSAMATCKRIFIVGYSFPMTDYQFYLTFRNAVRLNKRLEQILVVNRRKRRQEAERFRLHFEELLNGTGKEDLLGFDFSGVEEWTKHRYDT